MPSSAMKKPALQRNKSMDMKKPRQGKGSKPNPFSAGASTTKKPKAKAGRVAATKSASAKPKGKRAKEQGYNARLDESLGMRKGKASSKKQNYKSRRDESKGMEKAMGRKAYASVKTMDKGKRKKGQYGKES